MKLTDKRFWIYEAFAILSTALTDTVSLSVSDAGH